MPPKPPCLLLDAGAVFVAFSTEAWDALVRSYRVVVPAVIVRGEAQLYATRGGVRVELDLPTMVMAGSIVEWSATAVELRAVRARFKPSFAEGLDDGETEALACLLSNQEPDAVFVTGDRIAIHVAAMLDMPDRVTCLEEVLELCGHKKSVSYQHSRSFLRRCLEEGKRRFVTREGLV